MIHYKEHSYKWRGVIDNGRISKWHCVFKAVRKDTHRCGCMLTIVDGKLCVTNNFEHNHKPNKELMMKQKLVTNLISVLKQKKKKNWSTKFDFEREYNLLLANLKNKSNELYPEFHQIKNYLITSIKHQIGENIDGIIPEEETEQVIISQEDILKVSFISTFLTLLFEYQNQQKITNGYSKIIQSRRVTF